MALQREEGEERRGEQGYDSDMKEPYETRKQVSAALTIEDVEK